MSTISRFRFKRLVDELSQDQYDDLIHAVRLAGVALPGWTDRLASSPEPPLPVEMVRVQMSLPDLSRALRLAATSAGSAYAGRSARGTWIEAGDGTVRVSASDEYGAAFWSGEGVVAVPGTVLVDRCELWRITEALRKGLGRRDRERALVRLDTSDGIGLRVEVGDRWHRAGLLARPTDRPVMPPVPTDVVNVNSGAALREASFHVAGAVDWRPSPSSAGTAMDHVGVSVEENTLCLDAYSGFGAASGHVPLSQTGSVRMLVGYLWLREVAATMTADPVEMGHVEMSEGRHLAFLAGENWAAWTSLVLPWQQRFTPQDHDDLVAATVPADVVWRYLKDAKRLAESGRGGPNSWLVEAAIDEGALRLCSLNDIDGPSIGRAVIPAVTTVAAPVVVHFHLVGLLDAMAAFGRRDVTLHARPEARAPAYVTTAGYRPGERPPAVRALSVHSSQPPRQH